MSLGYEITYSALIIGYRSHVMMEYVVMKMIANILYSNYRNSQIADISFC